MSTQIREPVVVVTAAVPVEQREELERLAAERDRTLSYLIRQEVDDYLRDHDEGSTHE